MTILGLSNQELASALLLQHIEICMLLLLTYFLIFLSIKCPLFLERICMEVINIFVIYEMINKIFLINYLYNFILTRMKILAFLTPTESCCGFKLHSSSIIIQKFTDAQGINSNSAYLRNT